jgi:hypothetical protein
MDFDHLLVMPSWNGFVALDRKTGTEVARSKNLGSGINFAKTSPTQFTTSYEGIISLVDVATMLELCTHTLREDEMYLGEHRGPAFEQSQKTLVTFEADGEVNTVPKSRILGPGVYIREEKWLNSTDVVLPKDLENAVWVQRQEGKLLVFVKKWLKFRQRSRVVRKKMVEIKKVSPTWGLVDAQTGRVIHLFNSEQPLLESGVAHIGTTLFYGCNPVPSDKSFIFGVDWISGQLTHQIDLTLRSVDVPTVASLDSSSFLVSAWVECDELEHERATPDSAIYTMYKVE